MFDELLDGARRAYGLRDDNGPLTAEWPMGLVRRAYLEAGRRLETSGRLQQAAHVFELDADELAAVLRGAAEPTAADCAARAAHRAWEAQQDAPALLGPPMAPPDLSAFPPGLRRVMNIVVSAVAMLEVDPAVQRESLAGLGIGDRVHRGIARVATDPDRVLQEMEPGDVLVAAWTAPSYNAVFSIAGGVVVQEGGLLCHAAVMARELSIPSVIGCREAMTAIGDGDLVEVDPIAGQVRVAGAGGRSTDGRRHGVTACASTVVDHDRDQSLTARKSRSSTPSRNAVNSIRTSPLSIRASRPFSSTQ